MRRSFTSQSLKASYLVTSKSTLLSARPQTPPNPACRAEKAGPPPKKTPPSVDSRNLAFSIAVPARLALFRAPPTCHVQLVLVPHHLQQLQGLGLLPTESPRGSRANDRGRETRQVTSTRGWSMLRSNEGRTGFRKESKDLHRGPDSNGRAVHCVFSAGLGSHRA